MTTTLTPTDFLTEQALRMHASRNDTLINAFTELITSFVGDGSNPPVNFTVTAELKFENLHYENSFFELGTEIGRTLAWQMPEAVLSHSARPGTSSVFYTFRFRWSNQDLLERMRISAAMIRQNARTALGQEDIG